MVHCRPRDNMLKRGKKCFLQNDALWILWKMLRISPDFIIASVVMSAEWWCSLWLDEGTLLFLFSNPQGLFFFRLLVLHERRSDVTLPPIMLITPASASLSCTVAWSSFLTTDAAECQRVHALLPHALTIGPYDSWRLPSLLGFHVCQNLPLWSN